MLINNYSYNNLSWLILLLVMITIFNDIAIENDWGLTNVESSGYYYSINGFIAIELMLFLGFIIAVLHWRLTIPNWIMLNVMPYYLIYSLAIPFSNLLMLIISSIPIQCLQLMVKIGFMVPFIALNLLALCNYVISIF